MKKYQIGVLDPKDADTRKIDLDSPYGNEPVRHPAFKINNEQPFNGEPPPSLLKQSFITPNELHFIRNRLPVPDVDVREKLYENFWLFWHFLKVNPSAGSGSNWNQHRFFLSVFL